MEIEAKCPLWLTCGSAVFKDYHAKQFYPYGDKRRNYIENVCCVEEEYSKCEHYILKKRKEDKTLEEAVKKAIVVPAPYEFNSVVRILRRQSLIVKNAWLNNEPNQQEVDAAIFSIEAAMEILRGKSC